ncbi:DNA-binding NarL/FixJ family response regulator [Anaerobacterium chartisolvens]|uniref:DNA-binding NarL/FixJ family response regulator n=1 Tax=Anaerobacterium chartisolvens TaxID=1297424 RepID=A0A369BET4_9FIRM|nr:LuxR C-terminal-related transcriptional regulator [Anaerobacterium chartisolvens]RCX20049.1 DNA-binding NarL/FixJ family response regulator [Anaerobacterium chartisolvens]
MTLKTVLRIKKFFALLDSTGVVLRKKGSKRLLEYSDSSSIHIGVCLDESASGTNSIALAMRLKSSIYTLPHQHYCLFLKKWHIFSELLIIDKNTEGYLSLFSTEHLTNEFILITKLLAYKISNETKNMKKNYAIAINGGIGLTPRQLGVLKMIARGDTDMLVALKMGINVGTIRYHKTNIFRKLKVESALQAVVTALKLRLISLNDIDA